MSKDTKKYMGDIVSTIILKQIYISMVGRTLGTLERPPNIYIYIYIEALNAPKRTSWVLRKIKFLVSEK
jgi:hypothetical protein